MQVRTDETDTRVVMVCARGIILQSKLKCEPLFSHGPRTAVVSLTRIGEPLHFSTPRISSDTNPAYNTKVFTCAHCSSCSVFNTCTCGLSSCGHACGDRFAFTYGSATDVTVRRTDKPGGWGVNLVVTCSSKESDGSTCSSGSQCASGMCRGSNCCGAKGRSTGCVDCDSNGDCFACSGGFTKTSDQCIPRAQTCAEGRDAGMACTSPAVLDIATKKPADIPLSGSNDKNAKNLKACVGECDNDGQCSSGLECFPRQKGEKIPGCSGKGGGDIWDYCYDPIAAGETVPNSCASNVCQASEFGTDASRCCKPDSSVPCAEKSAPSMVAASIPKAQCGATQSEWVTAWSTNTIKTLEQCRAQCLADASCTGIVTGTFVGVANNCAMCTSRSTASTSQYGHSDWATYQAKKEDTGKACDASTIVSPTKECMVAVCTSASSGSATKRCAAYECDAGEYGMATTSCCDAKPRQKCDAAGLTCADPSTMVSSSARSVMRGNG